MTAQDMDLETMLPVERARLVRLCGRLTGDRHAAEDLAQETLVVAWRHERELRDPLKRTQWLSGIARNVCLHWMRRRGVEQAGLAYPRPDSVPPGRDDEPADSFDLEIALERDELAHLLDRALALLPPIPAARSSSGTSTSPPTPRSPRAWGSTRTRWPRGWSAASSRCAVC